MPRKPVVIIGSNRHGRNVLQALGADCAVAGFLDDTKPAGTMVASLPVLGGTGMIDDPDFVSAHRWIVGVGDNSARQAFMSRLDGLGAEFVNAVHDLAFFAADTSLGRGLYLAPMVTLYSGARLGDGVVLETKTTIGADVAVGDFGRTGPNCSLVGGARLGAMSFLGAGAVIGENASVGERCIVGANAVVLEDIADNMKAFGTPARASALED